MMAFKLIDPLCMYVQAALQWAIGSDGLTQYLAANGACIIAQYQPGLR
jgi:hypothetical protein